MNRISKAQRRAFANALFKLQGYREMEILRAKMERRRRLRRAVIHIAVFFAAFGAVAVWVRSCETQLTAIEGS